MSTIILRPQIKRCSVLHQGGSMLTVWIVPTMHAALRIHWYVSKPGVSFQDWDRSKIKSQSM